MKNSALLLFSGGQDSSICLAWALSKFDYVETIGFNYGQRHSIELSIRPKLLDSISNLKKDWCEKLGKDYIFNIPIIGEISDSSLTKDILISSDNKKLPNSFVPGRNLIFFTIAASLAYKNNVANLIGGMCSRDYADYPDCRQEVITKLEESINLGMQYKLSIETPLMYLSKEESWIFAEKLGGDKLIKILVHDTHTCYLGERESFNEWGYGCGECPACINRKDGYEKYKIS